VEPFSRLRRNFIYARADFGAGRVKQGPLRAGEAVQDLGARPGCALHIVSSHVIIPPGPPVDRGRRRGVVRPV
jgi:molybdopterin-biosynthesis enzyme MoeA-like protein